MTTLSSQTVRLGASPATNAEAIGLAAALLATAGHIDPAYRESMWAREKVANTYLGEGIAIPLGLGAATEVPHGGIFDLFVPGAVDKPLVWLGSIAVGTVVTTAVLFFLKRPAAAPAPVDALAHATSVAA